MTADIHPTLDFRTAEQLVVIEARVQAPRARALEWRLIVRARSPGGVSSTTQSGHTDGARPEPVSTVSVNGAGTADLQVFQDGRLVAETHQAFAPDAPRR